MKTRATLALAVVAGLPAAVAAQEVMQITYSWNEVAANSTSTAGVNNNSVVDPGEGARIRMGVTALINGTNAVGQTVSYTNPAPGGTGTVRGLGAVVYDLVGDGNNTTTAGGAWSSLLGAGAPFTNGQTGGTAQPGGASVHGMGGSQFVAPGGSVNPANANQQVFRGVWTPGTYAARTVNFLARGSVLVPSGQGNSVLLAYGQASDFNPQGDPYTYDLLVGKYITVGAGQGLNIPVAPAPSSLALLGLGALVAGGRRR